jgi:tRNA/rRNA methyltransferase
MAGADWAEGIEVEKLADHYEAQLDEAGFFFPAHKAESMKLNLRNLWSRQRLTRADVQTFHGMMRQMTRWARRVDREDGRDEGGRDAGPRLPADDAGDR